MSAPKPPHSRHTMRKLATALALVGGLLPAAAPQDQATLKANLDKKLAEDFVESGGWVLDYKEAREQAAKEKKLLFVYFTRSYAP